MYCADYKKKMFQHVNFMKSITLSAMRIMSLCITFFSIIIRVEKIIEYEYNI